MSETGIYVCLLPAGKTEDVTAGTIRCLCHGFHCGFSTVTHCFCNVSANVNTVKKAESLSIIKVAVPLWIP